MKNIYKQFILIFPIIIFIVSPLYAEILKSTPLNIKILFDNSGSMYPGYRLNGAKKSTLGVKFFYEYPEFKKWLLKTIITKQGVFNGGLVSINTFTVHSNKEPLYNEILSPKKYSNINEDDIENAFQKIGEFGQHTLLTETLNHFSQGFEGLIWLITDNVIDPRDGEPDNNDIKSFFYALNNDKRYYAVHLFKYRFTDKAKNRFSNLAIYGLLVSPNELKQNVIEHIDNKIFNFRSNFYNEHIKLKDLAVNAIEIKPKKIDVRIDSSKKRVFSESQSVQLNLEGIIRNKMTQHKVIKGKYHIEIENPFYPDDKASKEFKVMPVSSGNFKAINESIKHAIEPEKSQFFQQTISSKFPIKLQVKGIIPFIKTAFGQRIQYRGKARVSFYDIGVELQRSKLAGIYGIDQASDIFDFQDVKQIRVKPLYVPLEFTIEPGGMKGFALIIILLIILLPLCFLAWIMMKKEKCRIEFNQKVSIVPLFRLERYSIQFEGKLLGNLKRNLISGFVFYPNNNSALLEVRPRSKTKAGEYDVSIKNENINFVLDIKPLGGGGLTNISSQVDVESRKGIKRSAIMQSNTRLNTRPPGVNSVKNTAKPSNIANGKKSVPKPSGSRKRAAPPRR